MRYNYYRCEKCGAIVTIRQIKETGQCSKCGQRRVTTARFMGFNAPKPWEWLLIWLGVR